ncbi:facilitated trehalose transporter Tret1-like isoform X2 [Contarinia nasturtii]|nr:facilitated trehalose transporter Tret1-like isoform X2 [Contarinia nasturtii]XP_031616805.1 facilitated trehalose transporter Tret1-like isoform X2 [Contarinia nasturtii]
MNDSGGPMRVVIVESQQQSQNQIEMQDQAAIKVPATAAPTANPFQNKHERGKALRQVVAAFVANLGTINTGLMFGFSAVVIPQLKRPDSLIPINCSQESWIAALSSASTPVGCILSGILMDKIGRKKALLLTEIPLIFGWILIAMATDVPMIYAGRLLMGFGSGMVGAPARVYTSEVTQPHLRGMLSALAAVFISFGVLLQYTIGKFASWKTLSVISGFIPTIALISMYMMPETPTFYVAQSKPEKATKSLSKLRCSTYNIQREVDHLQNFAQKSQLDKKTSFRETIKAILSPTALKPFIILVVYFMMYQFSGVNTITFYAVEIFQMAVPSWDANNCAIFIGIVRVLFTVVGCIAMRRYGRRPLTFVSSIGCGISMICLGIYLQYKFTMDKEGLPTQYQWFPVACIFTFTICSCIGYLIVPWVMIGELYPQKVRGIIGGMTTFAAHSFVFIVVKTYPFLMSTIEQHGTFILYGVISLVGTIFYYFFLPETRGKTLQEIEDYFSGRSTTLKTKKQTASNFNININTAANDQTITVEKEKLLLA